MHHFNHISLSHTHTLQCGLQLGFRLLTGLVTFSTYRMYLLIKSKETKERLITLPGDKFVFVDLRMIFFPSNFRTKEHILFTASSLALMVLWLQLATLTTLTLTTLYIVCCLQEPAVTNPDEAAWLKYSAFWPDPHDNPDHHG